MIACSRLQIVLNTRTILKRANSSGPTKMRLKVFMGSSQFAQLKFSALNRFDPHSVFVILPPKRSTKMRC